ncbi:hypothetical protein KCP71_11245 [Salmonella enterica subsp. enterica]|nr:hypothetical protein KCP71_11245 [Salmonella enterica subsp. enterica]
MCIWIPTVSVGISALPPAPEDPLCQMPCLLFSPPVLVSGCGRDQSRVHAANQTRCGRNLTKLRQHITEPALTGICSSLTPPWRRPITSAVKRYHQGTFADRSRRQLRSIFPIVSPPWRPARIKRRS